MVGFFFISIILHDVSGSKCLQNEIHIVLPLLCHEG